MLNNGKFFLPTPKDGSDFKEQFKRLAAAGAGRTLGDDGFPVGPWTPELLAAAISEIDSNRVGVDLRTVQLWFQENDKGISIANIRWLARIFGCGDPVATSEWQMELTAAQARLTSKRRKGRKAESDHAPTTADMAQTATMSDETLSFSQRALDADSKQRVPRLGLAARSEAVFSCGSSLNLPAAVFAGATALGFMSYLTGVYSAKYDRMDGVVKQVGFLWAPNWTVVFMVLLPLFFVFVIELLVFWKFEGRVKLVGQCDRSASSSAWTSTVESSSATYWAVFLICIVFAGLFQWVEVCLIPLMDGGGDYAMDWGKIANIRPEVISASEAIVFTGFAYLYMSVCFYLFFVGLILLYTIVYDLGRIGASAGNESGVIYRRDINGVGFRVIRTVFRCTVLGILVAICMKAQSSYLTSSGENIAAWLASDMSSAFYGRRSMSGGFGYTMPTHYSSLLVVISR